MKRTSGFVGMQLCGSLFALLNVELNKLYILQIKYDVKIPFQTFQGPTLVPLLHSQLFCLIDLEYEDESTSENT